MKVTLTSGISFVDRMQYSSPADKKCLEDCSVISACYYKRVNYYIKLVKELNEAKNYEVQKPGAH